MRRPDQKPPSATAELGWRYHHVGTRTNSARPGEVYIKRLQMYVAGFDTSPYGVEWMRFEPDSPVSELVRQMVILHKRADGSCG